MNPKGNTSSATVDFEIVPERRSRKTIALPPPAGCGRLGSDGVMRRRHHGRIARRLCLRYASRGSPVARDPETGRRMAAPDSACVTPSSRSAPRYGRPSSHRRCRAEKDYGPRTADNLGRGTRNAAAKVPLKCSPPDTATLVPLAASTPDHAGRKISMIGTVPDEKLPR